ncbi:MAG: hypothetical protein KGI89_03095 [Euryarchaeota archaeon]|nr:hypothetical protein [Euryarchaeota archaeon]
MSPPSSPTQPAPPGSRISGMFLSSRQTEERMYSAMVECIQMERAAFAEDKHQNRYPMLKQVTLLEHSLLVSVPPPDDVSKTEWQAKLVLADGMVGHLLNIHIPQAPMYQAELRHGPNGAYYSIVDPEDRREVSTAAPNDVRAILDSFQFRAEENRFIDAENDVYKVWRFIHELFAMANIWRYNTRLSASVEEYSEQKRQENLESIRQLKHQTTSKGEPAQFGEDDMEYDEVEGPEDDE